MDARLQRNLLLMLLCISSLILLHSFTIVQPYYKVLVNQAHAAGSFVYAWATVCIVLLEMRGSPEVSLCACVL